MAVSLETLQADLERQQPGPVYLVLGPGNWPRRRAMECLRHGAVGDDDSPWAVSHGRAGETDLGQLLDGARTRPMGVVRRLVVLTGAENLKIPELELLAEYAQEPCTTTCLVLEGEKLPSTAAAARRLRAAAVVVDCPSLRPYQVPRWLAAEIKSRGGRAAGGVAERLQEILGDDPEALLAGLDKVLLYLGTKGDIITAETVSQVLSPVPHGTVWEFIEALEDRDRGRTLAGLQALLEQGEAPESILRLMARSRRQMLAGSSVRQRGGGDDQVLEAMGVHPKARAAPRLRRAILTRVRKHSLQDLSRAPAMLLQADSVLKGGGSGSPRVVLTRLVLDLLAERVRPRSRLSA
ncbi:MAG: DNA polymerase III subunit delta [Acidobacteria bacterium]|nr:DNA polymerase III subunit delta [Acidobacteriota bacterium]